MAVSISNKKNVIYNLIGQILPIIAGIISIPLIIRWLGTERFGIISIIWMVIGYFNLFDMGLGRALTQAVAEKIGNKKTDEIPEIFWTSLFIMASIAAAGSLLVILLADIITSKVLNISIPLQTECLHSFYVLALSMPFVIVTSALSGFISAYHRFDIVNMIRVPMSILMIIAPLIVLPFTHSLVAIVFVMALLRIVFCFIHIYFCFRIEPQLPQSVVLKKSSVLPLLRFGGWMTVSNIVGPFMVYFDRFAIGSFLSVTAVAYYTTPYEVITKLFIIPAALNGVTFPLYAAAYNQKKDQVTNIFSRSIMSLCFILYPIILVVVLFAQGGMSLWIGGDFASHSFRVLQWLAIGVFLNCLAQVPYTLIQGTNNPDITGKLHLMELLIYIPVLYLFIQNQGIEGAAIAWLIRTIVDTAMLFIIAVKKDMINDSRSISSLLFLLCITVPLIIIILSNAMTQYIAAATASVIFTAAFIYVKPYRYLHAQS